jgi:hypothetical protein
MALCWRLGWVGLPPFLSLPSLPSCSPSCVPLLPPSHAFLLTHDLL